ncbi:hypothetical protein [Devosia sediminis]|uniref:Uncharacterized protein n=1 Tax=Devosia sediminis TaxID=2798801 RepID=A0A934MLP8_9HYPH|nr:hypothetical protein [Devosia sediminis]MBJ3784861.1 hypothetical protein [Devosia sediminis]
MTMREKVAWISTLTSLVIFGWYFLSVWADFAANRLDGDVLFWRFIWCTGIALAIMLPASLLAARLGRQEFDPVPDELERGVERGAYRIGLVCLELSLVGIVLVSRWVTDMARADYPADPAGATAVMLVNLVLFVMAASALAREIAVIVQFRRYA